jgi:collagenase-like PrtC family protease
VLLESVSDVSAMHRVAENAEFGIEANDIGAVRVLAAAKKPFVGGPHLNVYNPDALEWIAQAGAMRWVAPIEMGQQGLAAMQQSRREGLQTEVFAFGRLPLAYSARCFTARHHDLPKDDCGFRCIEDPEGLMLRTREDEPFLVLNGIQTQSARVHSMLGEYEQALALGVDVLRLSPMAREMPKVIELFDAVRRARIDPHAAQASLRALLPTQECNGYWHGRPGLEQLEHA